MENITPNAIRRFINEGHAVMIQTQYREKYYELKFKYTGMISEWLRTPALMRELKAATESIAPDAKDPVVTLKAAWLTKPNKWRVTPEDVDDLKYYALNESTAWHVNARLYGMGLIDIAAKWDSGDQRYGWSVRLSPSGEQAIESAGKSVEQLKQDKIDAENAEKKRLDDNTVWPTWDGDTLTLHCPHFPGITITCNANTGHIQINGVTAKDLHNLTYLVECADYMIPSTLKPGAKILPRFYHEPRNPRNLQS